VYTRAMFRRSVVLLLLSTLAAACTTRPEPEGPTIDTADDLLKVLGAAGMEVTETAMMPSMPDLPRGRVVFLGDERVELYEADNPDDRQAALEKLLPRLPAQSPPSVWARGKVIAIYDGSDGATMALLSGLLGDSLSLTAPAPDAPYPPAVAAAIGWWAQNAGVDPGRVVVVSFEAAPWPDACLGLPQEGEACAQVVTSGWRVLLRSGDRTITLRADDLGTQLRPEP